MPYTLSDLLAVAAYAVLARASSFAAINDWLHGLDEQARERFGFSRELPPCGTPLTLPWPDIPIFKYFAHHVRDVTFRQDLYQAPTPDPPP